MSKIALEGNASGTGTLTIASQNTNSNYTLTLPNSTGTLVVTGGAQTIEFAAGTAAAPSITFTGDTNTGIFSPGADTIAFSEGGAEAMRIDSSGNVGIGTTSPSSQLHIYPSTANEFTEGLRVNRQGQTGQYAIVNYSAGIARLVAVDSLFNAPSIGFFTSSDGTNQTERARITSGGQLQFACTNDGPAQNNVTGFTVTAGGVTEVSADSTNPFFVNRKTNDGGLVSFRQDGVQEGDISVSGTTVSYNGGHLSRWAQTQGPKDDTLVKGTVLSNLDEMNVYVAPTTYWTEEDELPEGVSVGDVKVETHTVDNEQLNKVKVSDVEGDVNVAGVFVNWSYDEAHQVDEINMAMTGDMIIRIAQGVVVQKGDLLMSAGDGTAKPQGDDIVRSKTVAKVTSNHVTCTYADGSYCVPCVLMAC